MKTLYLHIGAGKTGTTAIQHSIYINRKKLSRMGFAIPFLDTYYPIKNKDYSGNGEFLIKPLVQSIDIDLEFKVIDHEFEVLIDALKHYGEYSKIIFSCEMLEWSNNNALERFNYLCKRNSIEVKIIYYVRDIMPYAFSFWLQQVKNHGYYQGWSKFAGEFVVPFKQTLSRFDEVFGVENIICRKYASKPHGKVVDDFYSIFEIDVSQLERVDNIINESLTGKATHIALYVNSYDSLSPLEKRELIRIINGYFINIGDIDSPNRSLPDDVCRIFRVNNYNNIPYVNRLLKNDEIDWG